VVEQFQRFERGFLRFTGTYSAAGARTTPSWFDALGGSSASS
jgi:hypothetical protein